jgi:prevent-host-death family protein
MASVGTFHAKTHLTQLLVRVANGERITITNRGKPVAVLVPPEPEKATDVAAVVRRMLKRRDERGPTLGKDLTIKQLIEEGRR